MAYPVCKATVPYPRMNQNQGYLNAAQASLFVHSIPEGSRLQRPDCFTIQRSLNTNSSLSSLAHRISSLAPSLHGGVVSAGWLGRLAASAGSFIVNANCQAASAWKSRKRSSRRRRVGGAVGRGSSSGGGGGIRGCSRGGGGCGRGGGGAAVVRGAVAAEGGQRHHRDQGATGNQRRVACGQWSNATSS